MDFEWVKGRKWSGEDIEKINRICEEYMNSGLKIQAIKDIRTLLSLGLREAKDLVEESERLGGFKNFVSSYLGIPKEQDRGKYRKINLDYSVNLSCPVCDREIPEDIIYVVSESGEVAGTFCKKCYEFIVSDDIMIQIKKKVTKVMSLAEHFKKRT